MDSVEGDADGLRVRGRHECSGRPVGYTLVLRAASDNAVSFELRIDELAFNRTYLTYASDAGEHFFGFGEQFTHFDLKGRKVPIFVMEQGVGRGLQPLTAIVNLVAGSGGNWHTTYTPVPHYVTSRLRSLALDNSEYSSFDLRKANRVTVEAFAPVMAGRIYSGGTPLDLIAGHTREAGRMRALPEWVHSGAIIGMQGGTARVRVMTYVNPFLVDVEDKPNHR